MLITGLPLKRTGRRGMAMGKGNGGGDGDGGGQGHRTPFYNAMRLRRAHQKYLRCACGGNAGCTRARREGKREGGWGKVLAARVVGFKVCELSSPHDYATRGSPNFAQFCVRSGRVMMPCGRSDERRRQEAGEGETVSCVGVWVSVCVGVAMSKHVKVPLGGCAMMVCAAPLQ